ncbi:MAG TPA: BTAD domain-containing putative transcriptional regulator [Thermoleophilaceae bacterium]|nr:BTAD domain-containing putative transcriptional regulator [Thermoleophilaceae bacterium]
MEFGVLGPMLVRRNDLDEPLGGPKQRSLLAMLLLRANEVVPRDRLIDGIWGERPPPTAAHTLDNYISRLRKVVGDDRLERRPPGYVLRVEPGELDLDRFERALRRGREALARERPREAADSLREALALWRGPALGDLQYEPFARDAVQRLEERRLQALEEHVSAELALGHSSELVPELEALVREHPFRERLLGQLMLALYRGGRQAEALSAFQVGRRRLAEELGLEPGPDLQRLQDAILTQDAELAAPASPRAMRPSTRKRVPRRGVAAAIAATIATASLAIVLIGTGGSGAGTVATGESRAIALSSEAGASSRSVTLPGAPAALAAGSGSLWVAIPGRAEVLRLDPRAGAVGDRIPVGETPGALAAGGGSVWAARVPGDAISRIDPQTGTVAQTVRLGAVRVAALAFDAGALWVADSVGDSLLELDPASGALRRRLPLEVKPTSLVVGDREIWVADYDSGVIAAVDRRSGRALATVRVGNGPAALAVDGEAVWVVNALDSTVSKVGATTGSLQATIPVGSGPTAITARGGNVWVANQYSATVTRIDARRGAVARTERVGGAPTALAPFGDAVWVGVRPLVPRRGGTLRLVHSRPITLDPALHVDLLPLQSDRLTRSGLVAYNHVSGPGGTQLVPDLAVSLPAPTSGGTVYTFRLRPGVRYSDARPVRATDFRRAIERVLALGSEASAALANIVGATACEGRGAAGCDLSAGIATDDAARTVTFRLREPDPEFLTSLTVNGLATPVPPDTPFRDMGLEPIPGTGPYKVATATEREVRYVRNAHFRERSHAAQPDGNPDEIVMRFGLSPAQQAREIAAGRADWAAGPIPPDRLSGLRARYPGRFHRWAIPTTDFLQLNLTLTPFNDVRVRRAFNLAIDRRHIVRLYGGPDVAAPTCQVLPPGIAGYRTYCPYTRNPRARGRWTGPDLASARRLVAASGKRGARVTVWGWTDDPTITTDVVRYAAGVLRRLGFRTRVHLVPHNALDAPLETIQVIPGSWGNDTPNGMFTTWFACDGPNVHGWFCDRNIEASLRRAQTLKSTNPRAAAAIWARVDRRLVNRAAWVPMINELGLDFVSERVRNYQFHPYWGLIADQLWLARP